MSESSRGRVTVTFGRSGQVVKRAGPEPGLSFGHTFAAAGTKRSIRDRLGSNMDSFPSHDSDLNSKRQRGSLGLPSLSSYSSGATHIGKDDLRFKLLQKGASIKAQRRNENHVDLREKLSKTSQQPVSNFDSGRSLPQSHSNNIVGRIPSTRRADDFQRMDSFRSSSSTWTLDHLRQRSPGRRSPSRRSPGRRSPGRIQETSRGLSPQRTMEDLRRNRTFDNVIVDSYGTKRILDTSRPIGTSSYMANSSMQSGSTKTVAPIVRQLPPPVGIMAKSSYPVDEPQTVDGFLHSLGLGKYVIIFKAEEVDLTALKQMGENDLKEIGIPMIAHEKYNREMRRKENRYTRKDKGLPSLIFEDMLRSPGPRKKILLALAPRSKR